MYRCDHCRGFMALGPHCDYPLCERCTRLALFGVIVEFERWSANGSLDLLDAVAELLIVGARERRTSRHNLNEEIRDGQREATAAFEDGRARERLGHTW